MLKRKNKYKRLLSWNQPWYKKVFTVDFILFAVISLVLWLFVFTYFGNSLFDHNPYDQHARTAMAWQQGKTDIEDLGYLEIAPYKGKYYNSFPPTPTLIEFPFTLFFGLETPNNFIQILLVWLGMLFSFFILLKLTENRIVSYLLAFAFFWGSNIFYLSLQAAVWHQGQLFGAFFTIFAILILLYCEKSIHLITGALMLGLAIGCRPFYLFMVPFYMYYGYKRFPNIKTILFIITGLIPPGLFYSIYNYVRFDKFWEFGHRYLEWEMAQTNGTYNFTNFKNNLTRILTVMPEFHKDTGTFTFDGAGSAIYIVNPIILIGLVFFFKPGIPVKEKLVGLFTLAAIWVPLLMHGSNGWFQFGYRFSVDLTPLLLFFTGRTYRKSNVILIPIALYAILINFYGAIWFYAR